MSSAQTVTRTCQRTASRTASRRPQGSFPLAVATPASCRPSTETSASPLRGTALGSSPPSYRRSYNAHCLCCGAGPYRRTLDAPLVI